VGDMALGYLFAVTVNRGKYPWKNLEWEFVSTVHSSVEAT